MLNRIVGLIRRWNRERLERRHLAKASGEQARGFLGRLLARLRGKNHDRLAHRRAQRQLLASLVANDTALLEGLVFLLKAARQAEQARAAADEALRERLVALEGKLGDGVQLVAARLQTIEARLPAVPAARRVNEVAEDGAAPARTPAGGSANGELLRVAPESGAKRAEPASSPEQVPGAGCRS